MKNLINLLILFYLLPLISLSQILTSNTNINITKYWYQQTNGYSYPMNIFVPSGNVPDGGYPVCILLHGNGGNGGGIINQFKNVLECHALVAPSGYLKSWNICNEDSDAPDIEMIDELINQLQTYSNINPNKIRILGSSNGAGLANNIFISNKNEGVDIICAIVSHLNEPQFHLGNFYISSNSTEYSSPYCNYDSLIYPLNTRKYLSISNNNDPIIPYTGGTSVVGVDFLDAENAAFSIATNQGYTGSLISSGTKLGTPEITEYSYLSGNVVHIKGDAYHGTNTTQKEYIKNYFADCEVNSTTNPIKKDILTIYPNPTDGNLLINSSNEVNEVRVYSINGALLMKSNSKSLTISSLSTGVYLFEVKCKDEITQRVIIKK